MRDDMRAKILAYNKAQAERKEKAEDLEVIVAAMAKLPWGQLKKLLTDDVIAVLEKYGVTG